MVSKALKTRHIHTHTLAGEFVKNEKSYPRTVSWSTSHFRGR